VRLIAAVVSFLLATGFEAAGSFVCLIPTQGMHGNERFVLVLLGLSIAFVLVNAVGGGIGLFPIGIVYGAVDPRRTTVRTARQIPEYVLRANAHFFNGLAFTPA